MTLISSTTGSVSPANFEGVIDGLFAGAAMGIGDAAFIDTDGLVYPTVGTAFAVTGTYARGKFDGLVMTSKAVGEPVTLFGMGSRIGAYGSGLTPGKMLYVSTTSGALSDAPSQVNEVPVAKVISATDILVLR